MSKYRIVKQQDFYIVEEKVLFFWVALENPAEYPVEFKSVTEAEEAIAKLTKKDVVVKEIEADSLQDEPLRDDEFSSWDDDPGYW